MSYKTILIHLNDPRRAEALLEPAIQLAKRYNAHLVGLHVYAAMPAPPIAIPYATAVIGAAVASERKRTEEIASVFARMTANQPFGSEWRALKVPHVDLAAVVMSHGRIADLIIAGQADPEWDLSPLLDFPEHLAMESGKPVLVVPHKGRHPEFGRNVVNAWKPTRESARAVFDALPLLRNAEKVQIFECKERTGSDDGGAADATIAVRSHAMASNPSCRAPHRNISALASKSNHT